MGYILMVIVITGRRAAFANGTELQIYRRNFDEKSDHWAALKWSGNRGQGMLCLVPVIEAINGFQQVRSIVG